MTFYLTKIFLFKNLPKKVPTAIFLLDLVSSRSQSVPFLSLKPKILKLLIVFDTYTAQWENFYQSSGKGDMDLVAYCSCTCWLVNQSHFWRQKVMLVRDKKTYYLKKKSSKYGMSAKLHFKCSKNLQNPM